MDPTLNLHAAQTCRDEADAQRRVRAHAAHIGQQARRQDILTQTVEDRVIPQLLAQRRALAPEAPPIHPDQVEKLAQIVLHQDGDVAVAYVASLHAEGVPAESIYLGLLAPAALILGRMWEDDTCDFTEVSIGLWKLQAAMREMRDAFLMPAVAPTGPRVMLVPLPGEQHTFGLSMVYDFFVRAGWDAWTGPVETSRELLDMVAGQHVDVLGFSLACDERLMAARAEIAAVRRASRNRAIVIMAGGPGFVANPALAQHVGADGTALDGLQAVTEAQRLLAQTRV